MSNNHYSTNNKKKKHPKLFFEQFLDSPNEPPDFLLNYSQYDLEPKMLKNSYSMKHHVRRIARKLRQNNI